MYDTYSRAIPEQQNIISCLNLILNNVEAKSYLREKSPGLLELSKYLLHKLLLVPVYHLLYLYETIQHLHRLATDDEDKAFLKETLDTLLQMKHNFEEKGFRNSKKRPVESSFRMYQPHHIQMLNLTDKLGGGGGGQPSQEKSLIDELCDSNLSHMSTVSMVASSNNTRINVLSSNINVLTEIKWKELELNVESFKNSLNSSTS